VIVAAFQATIDRTMEGNSLQSEQDLLYRVARELLQKRDYGELLERILDAAIEALGAERGCVVVREERAFRTVVARNFGSDALQEAEQEISTSIASTAVDEGEVLLIGDAQEAGRFRDRGSVRRLGLRSVLCAPLVASNEAFALVYLENRRVSNCFEERHRNLLREICSLAAPRLHTAVEVERSRQRARELELVWGEADGIVTSDSGMASLLKTLTQVAATELPVLIQGETGTGKELIARAVYRRSRRASGPLVVVNCAAIPANLIESELFGHARGAFTGAIQDRVGLIGTANRGTLFLDEIGEMPPELQPKLLRVLQSGDFNRLGSVRMEQVDVRVVASTNRDLEREVDEGRFRSDLYFRLSTVTLKVPPLRERPHDIHLLADHFLRLYAARWGREAPRLSRECLGMLTSYAFPGNVRELEGEMARLVAVSTPEQEISVSMLNERIFRPRTDASKSAPQVQPMSLAAMEKKLILAVLEDTAGNRTRAAEVLGISREGLRTKMQRLGLTEAAQDS
jgi:transcriptional regulator with GAF, ATPase, and Fis domain